MNAPIRSAVPCLEDYPFRLSDNVRFGDLDPNGHVNNAVYSTYFETSRVSLVEHRANNLRPPGLGWILASINIHFRAELHWPGKIDLGLGVAKFGRTSVTFEQAVFSEGKCIASAQSTVVLIDQATRRPTPLTDEIKEKLRRWARTGAALD